jgi:betaine-homocysteine S-methyltransferase
MNLIEKLNQGPVLCAEGYLFAMERRGYLQAGAYVPEVVLEHPEGGHSTSPGVYSCRQ